MSAAQKDNPGTGQGTNPGSNQGKIHPLTSLRFFAAFYVVIYHTLGNLVAGRFIPGNINTPFPAQASDNFGSRFLSLGFVSVSFFFLLSGYILAIVYLRRERPVDRKKFFVARFARVYPLFFLTLVLDTPFSFLAIEKISSLGHAAAKVPAIFAVETLMLQAWLVKLAGIDFPNWSLSTEALFYLSFPFIGAALWRLRGAARWTVAVLLYVGGQVAVYAWTTRFTLPAMDRMPLLHLSTFALGIMLASWQFKASAQADQEARDHGTVSYVVLLLSALAVVAIVLECARLPVGNMTAGLFAPLFMGIIWALSSSDTVFSRILSLPWLVVLGEASFGLYLLHIPVLHVFEMIHSVRQPWAYLVYLVLTVALSVLSFYFVEAPLRRMILARFETHPRESLEAASIAQ